MVRELDLTQATAHAILKTLCDRGWASRDPVTKTFLPGPALAVVAARTATARPLTQAARDAVLRLSHEIGYAGSVVERFDDSLVITAFEGGLEAGVGGGTAGLPGDRIPYAPPFGVAFAAWDTAEGRRRWIRRAAGTAEDRTQRLEKVLARTRNRGFDVDCTTPALAQTAQLVGTLPTDEMPAPMRQIMDQLIVEFTASGALFDANDGGGQQPVATISAPVFNLRGEVALIIAVHPFCALSGDHIRSTGSRLVAEASRVSPVEAART